MPGKPRSADTLRRVHASGFRYGRFKAVIRSGPRFRASRACCKGVKGGLRVQDWRRTSPRRACCAPRRPDSARLEGVQPPIRRALRTVGPLPHAPKRNVRPRHSPAVEVLGPSIRASDPVCPNETIRSRPIRGSGEIPIHAQELEILNILNWPEVMLSEVARSRRSRKIRRGRSRLPHDSCMESVTCLYRQFDPAALGLHFNTGSVPLTASLIRLTGQPQPIHGVRCAVQLNRSLFFRCEQWGQSVSLW